MRPCLRVEQKAKMCSLAASKRPVVRKRPLREIKTSRPQHLAHSDAKCGRPAAKEGVLTEGWREADKTLPYICRATSDKDCVKWWPSRTKSEHWENARSRAALYAAFTIIAKYFGRIKPGILLLMASNLD